MNILVIFTGGTIGSKLKDGWIATDEATKYTLIENYKEKFSESVNFTTREPYFLLSENLSSKELNLLINAVSQGINEDFNGIIITHGTDSLLFSAAAIHHTFTNSTMPIVFVSSNYTLEDSRSNANINFEGAVEIINSGVKKGVYISYKNPEGKHYIHEGSKAVSYLEADDSLYSINKKPFGIYEGGKIEILEKNDTLEPLGAVELCEEPKILSVSAMPEDSFQYDLKRYRAVILRPYHSGTLNTESAKFKAFCRMAKEENIPVFLVNAPIGTTYESAKEYDELGLIPLPLTTFASAYMRIWIGISRGENLKNLF